ncbi:hypothetical protein DFH07DRAFT_898091, partial [Mycena maculata]
MTILHREVATKALHNSADRYTEPACHPGTRREILQRLSLWAGHPKSPPIQWLSGSAGVGKTAIAQTFAGNCKNDGVLGAAFFFRRGHPTDGSWRHLFPTISYQLANSFKELLLPIQQAMDNDRTVVNLAMTTQFQRLIVDPFRKMPAPSPRPIIVLDGLDECEDRQRQQQILRLFIKAIRTGQLPVRLLIASRPERLIQELLNAPDIRDAICQELVVAEDHEADIRKYLKDEFSRIDSRCTAAAIGVGPDWPSRSPQVLEEVVRRSSGIFIYAKTIIQYMEDDFSPPSSLLKKVLDLDPKSTAPLDDLYNQVLS